MKKRNEDENTVEVHIFPLENGWTVGVGGGHYTFPLTKDAAIEKAVTLARPLGLTRIAIRDAAGEVEQWLSSASAERNFCTASANGWCAVSPVIAC